MVFKHYYNSENFHSYIYLYEKWSFAFNSICWYFYFKEMGKIKIRTNYDYFTTFKNNLLIKYWDQFLPKILAINQTNFENIEMIEWKNYEKALQFLSDLSLYSSLAESENQINGPYETNNILQRKKFISPQELFN